MADSFSNWMLETEGISELPSFDVDLSQTGDQGSQFRTENDPLAPFQRENYIERKGDVDVRCSCLDVIHGRFSADREGFATLIVLEFRIDARRLARRVEWMDMSFEFKSLQAGGDEPEVYAIAPEGKWVFAPTTEHLKIKKYANVQLGGSAPIGGITASGSLGWEKCVSKNTRDQTTVIGSIDLKGRNWGKSNCASWTLLENETAKTGVPALIRTAILLKRKHDNPFQCVVKIDGSVDLWGTVKQVFGGKGRRPKDDPVLFNPKFKPTNKLQEYHVEELGAFELEKVWNVTFAQEKS
jgi:hypothetical protein